MQGKALAALCALLAAVALAACGGGGESGPSASTEARPGAKAGLEKIEGRADEIKKERRRSREGESAETKQKGRGGSRAEEAPSTSPPVDKHSDSGGGVGQFRTKGGDNSIQELGEEGSASERAAAAAVLHAYLDARAHQRWETACSYLTAETVAAVEQFGRSYSTKQLNGCADILEVLTSRMGQATLQEAAEADVGALRIQGDHGFVLYHGARDLDYAFPVSLEAGEWRLASLEGAPLP